MKDKLKRFAVVVITGLLFLAGASVWSEDVKAQTLFSHDCGNGITIAENSSGVYEVRYPEGTAYTVCDAPIVHSPAARRDAIRITVPQATGEFRFHTWIVPPNVIRFQFGNSSNQAVGHSDSVYTGDLRSPEHPIGGKQFQWVVVDDEPAPATSVYIEDYKVHGLVKSLQGTDSQLQIVEGNDTDVRLVVTKGAGQSPPCFEMENAGGGSAAIATLTDAEKLPYSEIGFWKPSSRLDANGCVRDWSAARFETVGQVERAYITVTLISPDDNIVYPAGTIGDSSSTQVLRLKATNKDGDANPSFNSADGGEIKFTYQDDDKPGPVVAQAVPRPAAWIEAKGLGHTFRDGTVCDAANAISWRTAGGQPSNQCVRYFNRKATSIKWSTDRPVAWPYRVGLDWYLDSEGTVSNPSFSITHYEEVPALKGYVNGELKLGTACHPPLDGDPDQRDSHWQVLNTSPPNRPTIETLVTPRHPSNLIQVCPEWPADIIRCEGLPGSTSAAECFTTPQGMGSPPTDLVQYPHTEAYFLGSDGLPREPQVVVAESVPYIDIESVRVKEGRKARFPVTLSAPASEDVTINWRVRKAKSARYPASIGVDVEKAHGTLVIPAGALSGKNIVVQTIKDSHDDNREQFFVQLTAATGGELRKARAVGTIVNDGPMPAEWLKDYGLVVAEQTLDGVVQRAANFRSPPYPGMHIAPGTTPVEGQTLEMADLIDGASASATSAVGWSAWALTSRSTFDDEEDGLYWEGASVVVQGGVDIADGDWLFGTSFGHSRGDGSYHHADTTHKPAHAVLSDLAYIAPYVAYDAAEGRTAYATAGYGHGSVTLTPPEQSAMQAPVDWWMAAVGGSQRVYELGAFDASLIGDALYTGINSGDTSQVRESRSSSAKAGGGVQVSADWDPLTVSLQTQWRWDDEEEGHIEYGSSVSYTFGAFQVSGSGSISEASESYSAGLQWTPRHSGTASLIASSDGAWSVGWSHGPFHVTHSGDGVRLTSSVNF